MRKVVFLVVLLLVAIALNAQDLYVYSIIGTAEKKDKNSWVRLQKRDILSAQDIVRVSKNSALSIIDRKEEKIYSVPVNQGKTVKELIDGIKDNQKSLSVQFLAYAVKSLFNGGSDKISHEAAGCTYRGDLVEHDIAKAIFGKLKDSSLIGIDHVRTDYAVTFDLIERSQKQIIENETELGKQAFFRIKNKSNKPLYINISDINSDGKMNVCLPMDDAQTQSHLLIPANSTVDLSDYPIEFVEPKGTDCLLLVASEDPFDLRIVNQLLETRKLDRISEYPVGIYRRNVYVK